MNPDPPTALDQLVRERLEALRRGAPRAGDEELVRLLAGWLHELRLASAPAASTDDPAGIDEEETPAARALRAAEYRGRAEGLVKALALTLGHEAAARIEAEARARS